MLSVRVLTLNCSSAVGQMGGPGATSGAAPGGGDMGRSAAGGDKSRDASASCPKLAFRACRTRFSICSSSICGTAGACLRLPCASSLPWHISRQSGTHAACYVSKTSVVMSAGLSCMSGEVSERAGLAAPCYTDVCTQGAAETGMRSGATQHAPDCRLADCLPAWCQKPAAQSPHTWSG